MRRFLLQTLICGCVGSVGVGGLVAAQTSPPPSPASRTDWTLEATLTAALAQHPMVAAARAEVSAAEGRRQTATTAPNPIATYWREGREVSTYATLPIEPFLQRSSRTARADASLREAQAEAVTAERDVAGQAAHAFFRVALAQSAVESVRENLTAIQQLVDYLRTRVSQGATAEGEAIRAEVERDRVATDVTLAEVELLRSKAALRPWLGADATPLDALRVAAPDAGSARVTLPPFSDVATRALSERPELLASRARTEAALRAIDIERSLLVRQLGASFGLKRTAGTNAMVGGVSVTVPLFDRNQGEIRRATGERVAADERTHWLERVIATEVEAAYQASVRLVAHVATLQAGSLGRAEESRRIALGAYQEGAAPLMQVLDTSRALTDARVSLARSIVAASESVFELGLAAGYDAQSAARFGRSPAAPAAPARRGGSK